MKSINWKKILPHIIAFVLFIVIAALFSRPALEGKTLYQHDITQYQGSSKDIADYEKKHGEAPLWTNNMFSGMPTYQIWMPANNLLPHIVNKILTLGLPQPMQFFFLACILFYFLSQVARVNPYIGIFGALAFAYSTYNPVIISAGHVTKMWCIAYMPAMLASLMLIYRKKYLIGAGLLALFTATIIGLNHLQISYYLFFILAFYTVACLIRWIRDKEYAHLVKSLASVIVAALIGVMVNAVTLMTTYEYSKETIRGGSFSLKDSTSTGGLTKDYAFQYSYKPMETFTVMFPRIYGGSNGSRELGEDSKVMEALSEMPQQLAQQLNGIQSAYWGSLDMTSGPPYIGALVCFLFFVSLFFVKGEMKWWIAAASVFAILLSWGRFFQGFNYFMFDHLPLYNKFRAPSMSLVILELLWPFAAILGLQQLMNQSGDPQTWKKLKNAGLVAAGIIVVMLMASLSFTYADEGTKQLKEQVANQQEQIKTPVLNVIKALGKDRQNIFLRDIFKAFVIIGIFFTILYFYLRKKIKTELAVLIAAILLVLIDLLPIDATYLNKRANGDDAWSDPDEAAKELAAGKADQLILRDTSEYRVLNLAVSPFQDATTSYFHHSIGGYHAAKIGRYQDLWENKLTAEIGQLSSDSTLNEGLSQTKYTGLNMLNTKYIIGSNPPSYSNGQPFVISNKNALGPCWFVREVRFAADLKEEMHLLEGMDASQTAIVPADKKDKVTAPVYDSAATIQKIDNGENHNTLTYKSSAASPQFAVFSEVYYSEGWNAYIDGKKVDYVKTDYALRGMNVPAGNHTIEFKFEPASYKRGEQFTTIAQVLVLLLLAGGIFMEWKKRNKIG